MRRVRRAAALLCSAAGILALSACGGGGAYCATLVENSDLAATVYAPIIPGMHDAEYVRERLDLLRQVERDVPEELREDYVVWTSYLEEAERRLATEAPEDVTRLTELGDEQVAAARSTLSDHYTGTCME